MQKHLVKSSTSQLLKKRYNGKAITATQFSSSAQISMGEAKSSMGGNQISMGGANSQRGPRLPYNLSTV